MPQLGDNLHCIKDEVTSSPQKNYCREDDYKSQLNRWAYDRRALFALGACCPALSSQVCLRALPPFSALIITIVVSCRLSFSPCNGNIHHRLRTRRRFSPVAGADQRRSSFYHSHLDPRGPRHHAFASCDLPSDRRGHHRVASGPSWGPSRSGPSDPYRLHRALPFANLGGPEHPPRASGLARELAPIAAGSALVAREQSGADWKP